MTKTYFTDTPIEDAVVILGKAGWRVVPNPAVQTRSLAVYSVERSDCSIIYLTAMDGKPSLLDFNRADPDDINDPVFLDDLGMREAV